MSTDPRDDPVRRKIRQAMEEKGIGSNALGRLIGTDPAYISQFMGGRPASLTNIDIIRNLSAVLGIPEDELCPPVDNGLGKFRANVVPKRNGGFGASDVPVSAVITLGGVMSLSFVDMLPRPENLKGVPDVVAVVLPDDTLAPTYRTNDTLYFAPGIPTVGDGCLVELLTDTARVGLFGGMTAQSVVLVTGDGTELEIQRGDVRAILRERARLRG